MSKLLRPGMRVRFVAGPGYNERFIWPLGTTGVISRDLGVEAIARWEWRPDTPSPMFPKEKIAYSPSVHLEPIQDKPTMTSWESCGFHPRDFLRESEKVELGKPLKKQDEPVPR